MPFSEILGQDSAVALLRNLLKARRLPHALLFVGPEGVGKHLAARALAQTLLCRQAQASAAPSLFGGPAKPADPSEPCGKCPVCLRIAKGEHPDVHELSGSGAQGLIQIEPLRELLRTLQLHSVEGGAKVALLDPADRMHPAAANALLKTLEEPPAGTTLLLLARERSLVLPTLVSRCQVVRFGLLDPKAIARYLETSAGFSRIPPARLRLAAQLAGGSIGKAILLAQGELEQDRERLGGLLAKLFAQGPAGHLEWAVELAQLAKEEGGGFENLLDGLQLFLRDVAQLLAGRPEQELLSQDLLVEARRWAQRLALPAVTLRIEGFLEVRQALGAMAHKEMAALEIARRLAP